MLNYTAAVENCLSGQHDVRGGVCFTLAANYVFGAGPGRILAACCEKLICFYDGSILAKYRHMIVSLLQSDRSPQAHVSFKTIRPPKTTIKVCFEEEVSKDTWQRVLGHVSLATTQHHKLCPRLSCKFDQFPQVSLGCEFFIIKMPINVLSIRGHQLRWCQRRCLTDFGKEVRNAVGIPNILALREPCVVFLEA